MSKSPTDVILWCLLGVTSVLTVAGTAAGMLG